MNGLQLLLSDARGVYIPRDFCQNFDLCQWHVDNKYTHLLSSPDNEWYWDYWDVVCSNAYFVDELGNKWILLQDGESCINTLSGRPLLAVCRIRT